MDIFEIKINDNKIEELFYTYRNNPKEIILTMNKKTADRLQAMDELNLNISTMNYESNIKQTGYFGKYKSFKIFYDNDLDFGEVKVFQEIN